jgi:hypothetical protein
MDTPPRMFGKYRGRVLDNLDPLNLGRVLVECPALAGVSPGWAMPCVAYAGPEVGALLNPSIGASVWVEFEGGDVDFPIWAGCFWPESQAFLSRTAPDTAVAKTGTVTVLAHDIPDGSGFQVGVWPGDGGPIAITTRDGGVSITMGSMRLTAHGGEVALASGDNVLTLTSQAATLAGPLASISLVEDKVVIRGRIVTGDEPG